MKYLNTNEVADILCVSVERVRYLHNRNIFSNTIRDKRKLLISESDVLNYKEHLELLDSMYDLTECATLLEYSTGNLYRHYVKKGVFKTLQKIDNQYYVTKDEIQKLIEINKHYCEMVNFKTCEEVSNQLNIHIETVYRYISRGLLPNALKSSFYNSSWKIPSSDVEVLSELLKARDDAKNKEYKDVKSTENCLNTDSTNKKTTSKIGTEQSSTIEFNLLTNYYTTKQVANYFNLSQSCINKKIHLGLFTDIVKFKGAYFISKKEVHSIPLDLIKPVRINSSMTFDEIIIYHLGKITNKEKIKTTLDVFKDYLTHIYSNTQMKNKRTLLHTNCNMIVDLSGQIKKELYNYTDTGIINLISSTPKYKKQLIGFLNYILIVKSDECVFKNKYNYTAKIKTQKDKQIYSKRDFKKFYQYVKNIDLHKENALSSEIFVETWFYVFMHMTNAWRSSDVLNFPLIDFSEISNEYIEQALMNRIQTTDTQGIINIVSEQWERFVINKTRVLNKFLVNSDMVQTAATIFLILEKHRRKHEYNGEYLLPILSKKSSLSNAIKTFFKADPSLEHFSSQIANRSLITYFFHSVSVGSNNGDVAHILAQRLRRHIDQDTICQYVMDTNEDNYLDDTSYNLFKRGHFGWLYNSLVDIVVNKKEIKLSTNEKTKIIELYQKQYSPSEVEETSFYLLEQQNKQKSIALEIALLPNEEIEKRLYSIYMGSMPSKEEDAQCFYSKNCKNPTGSCKTCFYIIPRVHLLISLKNDLAKIINEISHLNEHDTHECMRKTHLLYRLLALVSQAIKSFDKAYVNSFIPLDALHNRLKNISDKTYLLERKGY